MSRYFAQIRVIKMGDKDDYVSWCKVVNALAMELKADRIEFNRGTLRNPLAIIHYRIEV